MARGNTDRYVVSGDRPPPHPEEVADKPELLRLFATLERSFSWTGGRWPPTVGSFGCASFLSRFTPHCPTALECCAFTPRRDETTGPESPPIVRSQNFGRPWQAPTRRWFAPATHIGRPTGRWARCSGQPTMSAPAPIAKKNVNVRFALTLLRDTGSEPSTSRTFARRQASAAPRPGPPLSGAVTEAVWTSWRLATAGTCNLLLPQRQAPRVLRNKPARWRAGQNASLPARLLRRGY